MGSILDLSHSFEIEVSQDATKQVIEFENKSTILQEEYKQQEFHNDPKQPEFYDLHKQQEQKLESSNMQRMHEAASISKEDPLFNNTLIKGLLSN